MSRKQRKEPSGDRWAGWRLHLHPPSLDYYDSKGNRKYSIPLFRCDTCAQILDWILQVSHKSWLPPQGLAGLIYALDDLLHPQANLCSFGREKLPLTREEIQTLVERFLRGEDRDLRRPPKR